MHNRLRFLPLLLFLLLLRPCLSRAEEAPAREAADITAACSLSFSTTEQVKSAARVRDNRSPSAGSI